MQTDRHAALRYLRDALPSVEAKLPGVRNEGFLATHELAIGARKLAAWPPAEQKAQPILAKRGEDLLRQLGFQVEPCDKVTAILRAGEQGQKLAAAVLLKPPGGDAGALPPLAHYTVTATRRYPTSKFRLRFHDNQPST